MLQPSSNLLANVNPTFNWVRLAERIPVRVRLDELPDDRRLIMLAAYACTGIATRIRAAAVAMAAVEFDQVVLDGGELHDHLRAYGGFVSS